MKLQLVISCEHASNQVPLAYQYLFQQASADLDAHRGWDPGSLEIADYLGNHLNVQPSIYPYTRLLIEPNRSLENAQVFSAYTEELESSEKEYLVSNYYLPYRDSIESKVSALSVIGPVLHLGIHTFTPLWEGKQRSVDIGILFDPDRKHETIFAQLLMKHLEGNGFLIKENEPYLGIADGFTTYLRTRFEDPQYLGFEIEVSQGILDQLDKVNDILGKAIVSSVHEFDAK